MKRDPTNEEHEKITDAILANKRVEATNFYLSSTERGLTEAQDFVKSLTVALKESNPEKFVRKKPGKRHWLR
jgi:hypothetical protein